MAEEINRFVYVPVDETNQVIVKVENKNGYKFSLEHLPDLVNFITKVLNKHPELELILKETLNNGSGKKDTKDN